jgi:hypothetical protein
MQVRRAVSALHLPSNFSSVLLVCRPQLCTALLLTINCLTWAGAMAQPCDDPSASRAAGSLLVIGRPGTGKTTLLRDIAHHLANHVGLGPRVVVVDTCNEVRTPSRPGGLLQGTAMLRVWSAKPLPVQRSGLVRCSHACSCASY